MAEDGTRWLRLDVMLRQQIVRRLRRNVVAELDSGGDLAAVSRCWRRGIRDPRMNDGQLKMRTQKQIT